MENTMGLMERNIIKAVLKGFHAGKSKISRVQGRYVISVKVDGYRVPPRERVLNIKEELRNNGIACNVVISKHRGYMYDINCW